MPPIYLSAPDDAEAAIEILRMQQEIQSVLLLQEVAKAWLHKRKAAQEEAEENAAAEAQRAADYAVAGASRGWEQERAPKQAPPSPTSSAASGPQSMQVWVRDSETGDPEVQEILRDPQMRAILRDMQTDPEKAKAVLSDPAIAAKLQKLFEAGMLGVGEDPDASPDEEEEAEDGPLPFTIRNLDTGEATAVPLDDDDGAGGSTLSPRLASKLSFGELQPNTAAWDACKNECRGVLEKLASKSTLSFRSYQLCVWQVRRRRLALISACAEPMPPACRLLHSLPLLAPCSLLPPRLTLRLTPAGATHGRSGTSSPRMTRCATSSSTVSGGRQVRPSASPSRRCSSLALMTRPNSSCSARAARIPSSPSRPRHAPSGSRRFRCSRAARPRSRCAAIRRRRRASGRASARASSDAIESE